MRALHRCRIRLSCFLVLVAATCVVGPRLDAQVASPKPAGARTLVGVVTDTLANPIQDARYSSRRCVCIRDRAGSFRFDSVQPGNIRGARASAI